VIDVGGEPGAGTPGGPNPRAQLRAIVDQALLLCHLPGALEDTSGGIAPARRLGDYLTEALLNFYDVMRGETMSAWLARLLAVPEASLAVEGPLALARMIDGTAEEAQAEFEVVPMSEEEERVDIEDAGRAAARFAVIPDDLPKEGS
jgi:hypothetical protein